MSDSQKLVEKTQLGKELEDVRKKRAKLRAEAAMMFQDEEEEGKQNKGVCF